MMTEQEIVEMEIERLACMDAARKIGIFDHPIYTDNYVRKIVENLRKQAWYLGEKIGQAIRERGDEEIKRY